MSQDLENKFLEADALIKQGDYMNAKIILEAVIFDYPNAAMVHNSLGWMYRTQFENYEKAAEHYKAAINFDANYPHSYFNYAFMLLDLDDPKGARQVLEKALTIKSVNKPKAHFELARVFEFENNYEKAMEYYQKAINISINNDQIDEFSKELDRCQRKLELSKH